MMSILSDIQAKIAARRTNKAAAIRQQEYNILAQECDLAYTAYQNVIGIFKDDMAWLKNFGQGQNPTGAPLVVSYYREAANQAWAEYKRLKELKETFWENKKTI